MRVNSVLSHTYAGIKKTPSFRADVRVNLGEASNFEDTHARETYAEVLKELPNKYKNIGSDNLVFFLTPQTCINPFTKKTDYEVRMEYAYKDTEQARLELIKTYKDPNNKDRYKNFSDYEQDLRQLETKDKRMMELLGNQGETICGIWTHYESKDKLKEDIEESIECFIKAKTYYTPGEPRLFEPSKPETKPLDGGTLALIWSGP